jgi:hypothetical protein
MEMPSGAAAPYDGIHQLVGATRAIPSASPIRTIGIRTIPSSEVGSALNELDQDMSD